METQFRPYGLLAEIATTTVSSITLTDTAGTALKCNYISVNASGDNPDIWFGVYLGVGSGTTTPVGNFNTPATSLGATSGAVGGYASTGNGVVEFLLSDSDRVDTIHVGLEAANQTKFFINYGQIQAGNIYRDNERPKGD